MTNCVNLTNCVNFAVGADKFPRAWQFENIKNRPRCGCTGNGLIFYGCLVFLTLYVSHTLSKRLKSQQIFR